MGLSASASNPIAYVTFNSGHGDQFWLDLFEVNSQRGLSKVPAAHAAFPPAFGMSSDPSSQHIATLRHSAKQVGLFGEYRFSSSVLIRDFRTGKTSHEIKGACCEPVVWSADGRTIAAGEPQRNHVGVWDACTGALLGRVNSHMDEVALAAFMPDGNLVTGSRDGTLRITNPATGRTIEKLEIEGHGAGYPGALIVADDSTIVSIWGSTVYIWFPYASQLASDTRSSVRRAEGIPLAISADGKHMLCRNEDGFEIMDILTGVTVAECPGGGTPVTSAAFSVDGSMVLLGRVGGFLEVWDMIKNDA